MEPEFLISWLPVFIFFILSFCSVSAFIFLSWLFTDNSAPVPETKSSGPFQYMVKDNIFRNVTLSLVILILFCSVIYLFPWALVVGSGTPGRDALPPGLLFTALLALGYLYVVRRQSGPARREDSVE